MRISIRPPSRWPRQSNLDLSLFKNFAVRGKMRLQFRAEFFNASNTAIFGSPGTGFGSRSSGVITATAGSPRQTQPALRLMF